MIRNGEITFAEVKRIFRRYWWIPVLSTFVLGTIGLVASLVLPKKYTSSTMVLVEQPTVPKDLFKPVVTDDLNQRLASMKAQILSRSRLESIIQKFNLYPQLRRTTHMEDLVAKLQGSIDVELIQPLAGSANREPPGFNINVTFDNPQLAQQICSEITSMFIEQSATVRVTQSDRTTKFFTQQLEEAKSKLEEQDKKLADFKAAHLGSLPEEGPTSLAQLNTLNTQLDANTQALGRAQQDKTFNETLLGQQEAALKNTQLGGPNQDTLAQQLDTLESQLNVLQAKYTPEHPDVIKLKSQIEDVRRRMADPVNPKSVPPSQTALREPASMQQLRARVRQDDATISDLTKRQGQIQDQIRVLQGRLQMSPMVEQQLKELTRNHQTASDIYNDLLNKREHSAMATDLEYQQEGETFKILDAPSLPLTLAFPKKTIFVGGGLGAGLALAFGILYLIAMSDKSMYSERDVELCLKLPVLTLVPSFDVSGHGYTRRPPTDDDRRIALTAKA